MEQREYIRIHTIDCDEPYYRCYLFFCGNYRCYLCMHACEIYNCLRLAV
jgi:hypothetical protein